MSDVTVLPSPQVNQVTVEETGVTVNVLPALVTIEVVEAQGPPGPGSSALQNVFIQATQPSANLPFLWVQDLGSGNYSVWVGQ